MLKVVLLFLALSGIQALPISRSLPKTHHRLPDGVQDGRSVPLPDDFKQGTEPSRRFIVNLDTGLVQDYINEMDRRAVPVDVPVQRNGGGWVRVEEHAPLPDGFRQGTEPSNRIPDGFRQGTEPAIRIRDGFRQGTEPSRHIPDGFRQGTEPSRRIPDGFRQGTEPAIRIRDGFRQGTEPSLGIPRGFRQGTEPTHPYNIERALNSLQAEATKLVRDGLRQEPSISISEGFGQGIEPKMAIQDGFRQGTERFMPIPDNFKQGTEPSIYLPEGFRQGTEMFLRIPEGFRQGTEPINSIPNRFRQGTEPFMPIKDGFRQGTEPFMPIKDGFRQGTEPFMPIHDGFRQGTEPVLKIPAGFRQGTEPSESKQQPKKVACKGEVINGHCYEFNPTPMSFSAAQDTCKDLATNAQLASVTSEDLHSRLVFLATSNGEKEPVLTWLGGMVKNQQASWVDGTQWSYSDWMPGQPNIHIDKPVCMEMFRMDETWWTAADCNLKRASICSYPISA